MSDETVMEKDEAFEQVRATRLRTNLIADRVAKAAGFKGELRPGAVVRLKSGGPPMTIAVFDVTDGLVYCHWNVRGRTGQARYSPEMLEPCEACDVFAAPQNPGPNASG